MVSEDNAQAPAETKADRFAAVRVLALVITSIFATELVIMLTLYRDPDPTSNLVNALLDSFLLIIVLFPALYLLIVRPMMLQSSQRNWSVEERNRFFTLSLDMLCIAGFDGFAKASNPAIERVLGFKSGEFAGKPFVDLIHPDDHPMALAQMRKLVDGTPTVDFECRMRCKDGAHKWLAFTAVPDLPQGLIYAIGRDVTESKRSVELFKTLCHDSPIGIYIVQDGKFQFVNPRFQAYTGYSGAELVDTDALRLVVPEDRSVVRENAVRMLKGDRASPYEFRVLTKSGEIRWIAETVSSIPYGNGRAALGNFMDITVRRQAEEATRAEQAFRLAIEESMIAGVCTVDLDGRQTYVNSGFSKMVGWSKEELIGAMPPFVYWPPEELESIENALRSTLSGNAPSSGHELRFRRRNEDRFDALVLLSPLLNREGRATGWLASVYDMTRRKCLEAQLAHLAAHDPLTGLSNRRSLEEALDRAVARARRGSPGALLFLDVDDFKTVNDTLGHAAGDRALVTLSQLLQEQLRAEDVLARVGGDEFAVLLGGTNVLDAHRVAERIRDAVEGFHLTVDGHEFNLSLSVGLVTIDGLDAPTMVLSRADTAMYKAKAQGGNRVLVHRQEEHGALVG